MFGLEKDSLTNNKSETEMSLDREVRLLKKELEDSKEELRSSKVETKKSKEEMLFLEKDTESNNRILNSELNMRVEKAILLSNDSINRLEVQNAVLTKENEILDKAFSNMGFDVKDMKGILDKLVDGIVSKNEIKVIK